MSCLAWLLLLAGAEAAADSKDFPKKQQQAAIMATVRIANLTERSSGSGTVVGKKGPFLYVLTAYHLVKNGKRLEIATFSAESYPKTNKIYRKAEVLTRKDDIRDLAIVRVTTGDEPPGSIRICPADLAPKTKSVPAMTVGCGARKAPTCLLDLRAEKKQVRKGSDKEEATFWEVDSAPKTGRSGGALVDKAGMLIGVCSGANRDKGYYCHIEEIHRFLRANGLSWLCSEMTKE